MEKSTHAFIGALSTFQQTATDLLSLISQTHTVNVVQRHIRLRQWELRLSAIHHHCGGAPYVLGYLV